jgi:2,3-bisphosphoglycerate-independent phosphoglycerate mutase
MKNIAGEYLSELGLTQFRCAETEKYPHVTFFFNDYRDEPFEGEDREIIQSPKVATYDLQPEMSAYGVATRCSAARRGRLRGRDPVVNFANGDMVGHTGSLDAAMKACETVDGASARSSTRCSRGGCADRHRRPRQRRADVDPETTRRTRPTRPTTCRCIVVGEQFRQRTLRPDGRLADILPTMLEMMNLPQPEAMTGETLLVPAEVPADAPVEEPVTA